MNYSNEDLYSHSIDYSIDQANYNDHSNLHEHNPYDTHHDHSSHNENDGSYYGNDHDHSSYDHYNSDDSYFSDDSHHNHTSTNGFHDSQHSSYEELNNDENHIDTQRSGSEQNPFPKSTPNYHDGEMIVFEKEGQTMTGKILSIHWESNHYVFKVEKKNSGTVFVVYGADILGAA
ncbi:MAG: hypothetical protein KA717_17080 [Woronichinia naegeliana WA131]|jgi:hypothetical protein|uniref:Uncharacterized protein n=1 Tax=Woronichinia naegeliana WA131 TaxID=2824559 RepID=A0A977PZ87_9CYAN|nr:MAG: hypothetical protein KA717_17080 [Woronichinia naegeliana WA131]